MSVLEKLIIGLDNLKNKGIKSFKLPMGGDVDFNIEELLKILKTKLND